MPHYFFHVKRGQVTILDQEGIELADTTEAEREAARRAREVLTKDGLQGRRGSGGTMPMKIGNRFLSFRSKMQSPRAASRIC